jgi:RNA polymerase sigma factor (sigma-70 family)
MPDVPVQPDSPADRPRAWLEENVGQITRIAAQAARRHRLPPQDRQELLSIFWTHLAKDDYRVLRQFRGSSGIGTYLRTVVDRVVLDMRTASWGKWRPSARARRLGPGAQAFERLVLRDGRHPDEALALVGDLPAHLLAALAARRREPRRFVSLDVAAGRSATKGDPFAELLDQRRERRGQMLGRHLERTIGALPADDQLLIRMRHELGMKVSQIAAILGADQKRLYRRFETIHDRLRNWLTAVGVSANDVVEITSADVSHVPRVLDSAGRGYQTTAHFG